VFSIKPFLTLEEEYDDNIYLTKDNKVDDYVTRVIPAVSLDYKTPIWDLTLSDTFYWWYYAKQGTNYTSNTADLSSKLTVIKNFFYFDVTDNNANVVLNPRGPSTTSNLNLNQTNSNTLNAMPYIKYQVDPATEATMGLRYTNLWYNSGTNRQEYTGLLSIKRTFDPKLNASVGVEYLADRPESVEPNDDQTAVYGSVSYIFDPRTKFEGTAGYRWISFSGGSDYDKPVYDVGLVYQLPRKGQIAAKAVGTFTASPEQGLMDTTREELAISYGEMVSIKGSIYHERDNYFQIGLTDDEVGGTVGLTYTPNARLTYKILGKYEKDKYQPQDDKRDLYSVSTGINYKLTAKTTIGLSDDYNRSTGQIESDNYTDNIVRLSLTIALGSGTPPSPL
jgi:hypothetical protein